MSSSSEAVIDGRDAPPPGDPMARTEAALGMTAARDADLARAFLEVFGCITLLDEVMARPGMPEKVLSLSSADDPPPIPGPTREELLALVG